MKKGRKMDNYFTKRILLLLATLVSVPLLSGCWDRVKVNDQAIVTAAAIDKKDDNQIELSNQIFILKTLSSGDGEAGRSRGGKMTVIASQTGKNIAEALFKRQGKMLRKIFGEQYSVFIFSEKIAKRESKSIWIFYSGIQSQEGEPIYMSVRGRKKEILKLVPNIERYSADV